MQIRDGHFGRGDQEQVISRRAVDVVLELGQLPRPDHDFTPHEKWRRDLDVAVLARVQVEHEVDQGPRESRAGPHEHRKSRARELGPAG